MATAELIRTALVRLNTSDDSLPDWAIDSAHVILADTAIDLRRVQCIAVARDRWQGGQKAGVEVTMVSGIVVKLSLTEEAFAVLVAMWVASRNQQVG